jgi:carbon-monoxide dehydrogenase iron sulfur subunit
MKIIVTDLKKCLGCHSCELACAISRSVTKNLLGAILEDPKPATRVRVLGIGTQPVPLQCQQCEDAPCAAVCPTAALYRLAKDETVLFKRELCIGCSSCVLVCPFGAIRRADGGVMAKCSLCWDRLAEGKPPACVEACPTKARKLVEANVVAEDKLRKTALALASLEAKDDRKEGWIN